MTWHPYIKQLKYFKEQFSSSRMNKKYKTRSWIASITLHKKWGFPLSNSSVNVTKSAGNFLCSVILKILVNKKRKIETQTKYLSKNPWSDFEWGSPYSVRMRENTDQNNFLHSATKTKKDQARTGAPRNEYKTATVILGWPTETIQINIL